VLMCVLLGIACWSFEQAQLDRGQRAEQGFARDTWLLLYYWLMGLQGVALTVWALSSCAQSVSAKRDHKTWEFQRTTGLTAAELLVGKLMGEPILVYFAVACAAPITLIAGRAGFRWAPWFQFSCSSR